MDEHNPFPVLESWLKEAQTNKEVKRPYDMVLSTRYGWWPSPYENRPLLLKWPPLSGVSSRVVLFKELNTQKQIVFYTNYRSLKCSFVFSVFHPLRRFVPSALNFHWPEIKKQISLEGTLKKTPRSVSVKYWDTRPKESQISQYVSKQSGKLENRKQLEQEWENTQKQFEGKNIPCPKHWGGMIFTPHVIKFWEEHPHRLHHRECYYRLGKHKWKKLLFYP